MFYLLDIPIAARVNSNAIAISMLNNKLVIDVVNGNGTELLQYALSKQQRGFLVLDH